MSLITVLNGCTGKSPDEIVSILNQNGWVAASSITREKYDRDGEDSYVYVEYNLYDQRWNIVSSGPRLRTLTFDRLHQTRYYLKPSKDFDNDRKLPPDPTAETIAQWKRGEHP